MATEKKKPVIPRRKDDVPEFENERSKDKYNWKLSEGDWVSVPLDKNGVPLVVMPKKDRKK